LALCVAAVWRPLSAQDDFWSQAAVGRWICENRAVPHETLFLWSASEPWIFHSWLTGVVFYGLTVSGPDDRVPHLLQPFTGVLVVIPYLLAWRVWARHSRITSWMVVPFALGIVANFHRYQTRPELFTALLLSCLLVLLIGWSGPLRTTQEDPTRREVWWTAAA